VKHTEIIDESKRILVQRGKEYGDMRSSFRRIAFIANAIIGDDYLDERRVAVILHALKLSRIAENPKHIDSYVDGVNYLAFAGELATIDEKENPKEEF
jgi:hypothetical protein